MAEEKKIQIPEELEQNVKVSAAVVECYCTKDGTQFFLIRNTNGQVIRIANTPEEIAMFFSKLANTCGYE